MELVVVELDVTKCVEVDSAELVGGTDLDSGRDSGWSAAATGGAITGEGSRWQTRGGE
jgi:hypothetical protein